MFIVKWIKSLINEKREFKDTMRRFEEAGWLVSYY